MVIDNCVVRFWSEIIIVISSRIELALSACSILKSCFMTGAQLMISDKIALPAKINYHYLSIAEKNIKKPATEHL